MNVYYSNDLNRDIDHMLAEESGHPRCAICGEEIQQAKAWRLNDKWFCDYCECVPLGILAEWYKEEI